MGYFKHLANSAFKSNPEGGGWLYYPNGILSKGRIVTDKQHKDKLFNFQKHMYMFLMPLGVIYGIFLSRTDFNLYDLIPIVIILAPIYLRQYWLIRNLPKCNIKLKYNEATSEAVKGLPMWVIYVSYTSSAMLITIGFCSPWFFNKPISEVIELALMLIGFGMAGILLGLIAHKYKKSNEQG
ncbi:MAG: hypothetical protein OQK32_01785 [Gammaproteobacteria bacterium]|nr:hypothetical protein [Gammaproteobacteria bacterium]MCW8922274.1 hypothetical protein [Gammaproteobacteria bacterium]